MSTLVRRLGWVLLVAVVLGTVAVSTGCSMLKQQCYEYCKPDPDPPDPGDIDPSWTYCPWDRNVTEWEMTIPLNGAHIRHIGGHEPWEVVVDYEHLQNLPKWYQNPDPDNLNRHNVNGSIWLIRDFRGTMYIGTIDYLRVGQKSKRFTLSPSYLIEYEPGEKVGVMVSTTARQWDGTRVDGDVNSPYRQRSNIVWTKWPEVASSLVADKSDEGEVKTFGPGEWFETAAVQKQ